MKIQDLIEGCKHGEYYCSTDKKWKCRQGPKQTRATEAANPAQQAAIAIAKKKKKDMAESSLKEFAPVGSNDGNDGFSDDTLKLLAAQWYNGDEDPKVERTLLAAGWEIGQDEGYDDEPGVFVVQAGDINGNSYMSWPADELRQGVAEAFDQPYKGKWEKSDYGDVDMLTKLPDGTNLSIMFNNQQGEEGEEVVQVEFYRNNSQEVTGEGDAQRIFATVLDAIQKYIKKYKPQKLSFSASKATDPTIYYEPDQPQPNPESRAKLYDRLVQRYSKALGYRAFRADNGDIVIYELSRIEQGVAEAHPNSKIYDKCWDGYKKVPGKKRGEPGSCVEETYHGDEFYEAYGELWFNEDEQLDEAEYHGRKVTLGKPMQGDVKKFKVYVKDPSTGNIKKVNFGDPDMRIKKSNPARRRSFRARHNCDNPGPRTKARYWSCRKW